jgi:uncharacterized protein YdeI (YjbR/CyaY-like superfamily)
MTMQPGIAFRATIELGGKTATGIEVPPQALAALGLDDEPREVTVPADFAAALDTEARAREAFERLSYGNRLRWVLSVEGAKTESTCERRIAKAVRALREDA